MFAHVTDQERVAKIRFVRSILQERFLVRNSRELARPGDRATLGEFLEDARQYRFDCSKDIDLGDKAHLEVELIELAGRAISTRIFVSKTRRDLEIAVETRDHDQLLEHLRRLGKCIEFPRMDSARHEIVASALRRTSGY